MGEKRKLDVVTTMQDETKPPAQPMPLQRSPDATITVTVAHLKGRYHVQ